MADDNSNLKNILKGASLANQQNEILVCSFSTELDKLKSSNAKILKTTFLNSPSKPIISNGTVKAYTLYNNGSEDSENDLENDQDNNLEFDSDNDSENSENDNRQDNENYHYTMLESFIELNEIYSFNSENKIFNEESDDTQSENTQPDDTPSDNIQSDDTQSEENKESDDTQQDNTQSENTQQEENEDKFQFGYILAVDLVLKNEGMTRWVVAIDSRTESDIKSIINALNSKKFKAAFNIAGKGLKSDGLVPLAVYTFINKKDYYAPFMGNCKYSIAQGSVEGTGKYSGDATAEDDYTICLAIAPINIKTRKPNENLVYKIVYNITKVKEDNAFDKFIKDIVKKDNDKGFIGDSDMYNDFLNIRKYIQKCIQNKTLEIDTNESTKTKEFSNKAKLIPFVY